VERKFEVPSKDEIRRKIEGEPDLMKRAFFALTYLTAGRINEVVPCKKRRRRETIKTSFSKHTRKWTENINYEGVKKGDISFDEIDGRRVMVVTMRNEKNRRREWKRLPVVVEDNTVLVGFITDYISDLEDGDTLFDFSSVTGWKYIKESLGFNPHYLRHVRLTHLVQLYNYDHILLMKFAGWSNTKQADRYLELSWKDLVGGMVERVGQLANPNERDIDQNNEKNA